MALTTNNSATVKLWSFTPNGIGDTVLKTKETYLDRDINVTITAATYDTVATLTTTTNYPQLVATPGWTTDNHLKSIKLGNGQQFELILPNGAGGQVTLHFTVDASGNVKVT